MKMFFTKKFSKKELAAEIYDAIHDTAEIKDNIDSDTNLKLLKTQEDMGMYVWNALVEVGIWDGYKNSFEVDFENVSMTHRDFGEKDFLGFHTLENDLTYLGVCFGGDWETPVYAAIFHGGGELHVAVPIDGNTYNTKTGGAYGNDALADASNMTLRVMQEQFKDMTCDHIPDAADDTEDALIDVGEQLSTMIHPRCDLMIAELNRDLLYYDVKAEEGQQVELPELADITTMIHGSKLADNLSEAINEAADARFHEDDGNYACDGALECSTEAVEAWVEAEGLRKCDDKATEDEKKEEAKEVAAAVRKHFRDNLPNAFPLPIITEDREILFKPGAHQDDDAEGEALEDTTMRQQVDKFKEANDVQRRLALHRLTAQIAQETKMLAQLSEADLELLMKEATEKEDAAKEAADDKDDAAGPDADSDEPEATSGSEGGDKEAG